MERIRVQKFLSQAGIASRRKVEELITELRVEICDDKKCQNVKIGDKIDPERDIVKVDGKVINLPNNFVYYAVNKPVGYTSSVSDKNARKLVVELVPYDPKVWPVGRLDKESSGLILLTNDGDITNKLTHPRFRHEKEYEFKCRIKNSEYSITDEDTKLFINKFNRGITLTEGIARFDKLEVINIDKKRNIISFNVVLHQGWKRQIRRMCEKVGLYILELKRIRIAKLELGDIKAGEFREITKEKII